MKKLTVRPELAKLERGEIVMTKKELDALIERASTTELEIIFLELVKIQESKWQKAKSPNVC